MRVLVATNMYPTSRNLTSGVFVEQQVRSLRELGVEVQVLHFDRMSGGRNVYWSVRVASGASSGGSTRSSCMFTMEA